MAMTIRCWLATLAACVAVGFVTGQSTCPLHVDSNGCRANSDIANIVLTSTNVTEQVAQCSALCCSMEQCDAWAVWEMYDHSWATNCSKGGVGRDCCLLKKSGWDMGSKQAGCTSGGKSAAPTPPSPPPPPPPAPPLPHGGGQCSDDWGCSLGGECESGACVCDPQYTGAHCDVVHLRRAKINNGLQMNTSHTWGGHALKDNSTGKWVGFFSYMAGHCGLSSWQSASMIISATADAPDGPYNQNMVPVTAPWSHNAMISRHPNGSFLLFHIGEGTPIKKLNPCTNEPDPMFPFPTGHPEPAAATTHIADNISGPWRAAPGVPGVNNPCPFFFANGTTLLFDRTTVRWAPSVDYQGTWQSRTSVAQNGTMIPEDPGVYRDQRGNFHMLFNSNSDHKHCPAGVPCGGHTWSRDGLAWASPTIPAFGTIVHYNDNTTVDWDYVERPQVAQDDDGTPLTLFLGQSYKDSHSLAIMFCQKGDSDCVTTIQ